MEYVVQNGNDEEYDDHFAEIPRNAGHNVGGEEVAAPERLLALHERQSRST